MTKAYALALLLLAGCDKPVTRSEAEDIAADYADTTDLRARISSLENEVETLKAKQDANAKFTLDTFNMVASYEKINDKNIDALFSNDRLWRQHITQLRWYHGLAPLPEPEKVH